ncbi:MAG: YceI family protein, partial [Ilumatobacteraceae bacterium]
MTDTQQADTPASWTRFIKWIVIAVLGLVALLYGAIFFYANVLNDSPDALDENDLGSALVVDTEPDVSSGETAPEATSADTGTAADAAADGFDGDWVATDASEFGYRVEEVLAGVNTTAVGRSNEIDAVLSIDGTTATAIEVVVPIDTISSDDGRRDGQFHGRIMNASEFPNASFTLTEPIDFGSVPTGDDTITASATGDLTFRGVTNS